MKWQKQGVIFDLEGERTQSPTAIVLNGKIRIYYSTRINGKSHIYCIEISPDTFEIGRYKAKPVLSPGKPGSFDENGCVPGCITSHGQGVMTLWYTGFSSNSGLTPYKLSTGCAISADYGESFAKDYRITEGREENNYIAASPFILDEGGAFKAAFISVGKEWCNDSPIYKIPAIFSFGLESTARPAIVKDGDIYKMWFSKRQAEDFRGGKGSYRMGYAESTDLKNWRRDDSKVGIDVGEPGEFDSEMQAYPSIVKVNNKLIMFYTGNGFGETGIGCATAEL